MIFRFQDYRFDRSKYERPSQKWVCGWACEGKGCHLGPDVKGRCITTYECVPLKKGDRWFCARSKSFGGTCQSGPLSDGTCCNPIPSCQPVLSTRAKRGVLARWVSAFVFGMLLLFAAGASRPDLISPGELGSHHQTVSDSCGNCHSAYESGPVGWLRAALSLKGAQDDRKLCLSCHILGENSSTPHGISNEKLSQITEHINNHGGGSNHRDAPAPTRGAVPCAACHQEHRGKDADLTAMSSRKCQTCHSDRFVSFSRGHPEFLHYPFQRRTRLIFDHTTHMNKHFTGKAKDRAPNSCKSCHITGPGGNHMTVLPFKQTCAACHEGQILGESSTGAKGVPFISLPGLDTEGLKKAGIDVGEWPPDAEGEGLNPFMRLLLSANPGFVEIEATLKDIDLLDLSGAGAKKKSAAGRLAWAIKGLVFDLAMKGQQGLRARLEKVLSRKLTEPEFSRMSGQLPVGVVRSAQAAWFPNLAREMARREAGEKPGSDKKTTDEKKDAKEEESEELPSAEEVSVAGGWYVQDFSLLYRPSGHEDRFLRGWLELEDSGSVTRDIFSALSGPKAIGYCGKCHSIDRSGEGTLRMNWKAEVSGEDLKSFTRFAHEPHFSLLDEKGCLTCHKLNSEAKYLDGFKDTDPATFASNFQIISKAVCANCHAQGRVSENCLTCHNYHVGKVMPALTSAAMKIPTPR